MHKIIEKLDTFVKALFFSFIGLSTYEITSHTLAIYYNLTNYKLQKLPALEIQKGLFDAKVSKNEFKRN